MDPLQVISEWMPNGTLIEFVKRNPVLTRIGLVSPLLEPHFTDNVILPSCWTYLKASIIFT